MSPYKLVICDIDGTLVDNRKQVTPLNKQFIEQFKKQGGMFSLATGRIEKSVDRYCRELDIDVPVILYNGARIVHPVSGDVILDRSLSASEVRHALSLLRDFPFDPIFYSDGEAYILKKTQAVGEYESGDGFRCLPVKEEAEIRDRKITKILMIGDNRRFGEFREKFQAGGKYRASLVQSEHNFLEILPEGVNKGTALAGLADHLGLTLDEVVCFGDNLNDLEMIQRAGMGVAMGNAHEMLKEKADLIAPLNTESGVGQVINKIISGGNNEI